MRNFIYLFLIINLISCKDFVESIVDSNKVVKENEKVYSKNFKVVKVDSLFQISIPKYMKELKTLNPDATLQYANIYKEVYTVVIVENKYEFLNFIKEYEEFNDKISLIDNYYESQLKSTKEVMNVQTVKKTNINTIDELNARQFVIKGKIDNINIAYQFTFVESENDIYQIINWTLKDRYSRFEQTFKYINSSFFRSNQIK